MFKTKYPQLRQHQELISKTGFLTPLTANSESRISNLPRPLTHRGHHNVALLGTAVNCPRLVIRMFLHGQQFTIAQISIREFANALRLADLAQLFFWKYRIRGGDKPSQLNLSIEQAEADLKNEKVHVGLLQDYENILLGLGVLPTPEKLAEMKAAEATPSSLRREVSEIKKQLNRIEDMFKQLVIILQKGNAK